MCAVSVVVSLLGFFFCFCLFSLRLVSSSSSSSSSHNSSNSSCCKTRGSSHRTCDSRLILNRYTKTRTQNIPHSFLLIYLLATDSFFFLLCLFKLARIMAVLQQRQQQQQVGGLGGSSRLSPSHHGGVGGGGAKMPGADPLPHPGLARSVADLHQKTIGPYSGEQSFQYCFHSE